MSRAPNTFFNKKISCFEKTAIKIGHDELTYSEFYAEIDKISGIIERLVSQSNINISICLPKKFILYSIIYSVLKLKNCYVPIDYISPIERFSHIVLDSKSELLFTTYSRIKELEKLNWDLNSDVAQKSFNPCETVVCIIVRATGKSKITHIESISSMKTVNENSKAPLYLSDNTPAYLLYTSGTTDKPKGILHSQRSMSSFINWSIYYLNLSSIVDPKN